MIFTERNITIRNDSATINAPVILYRGDKNVEVRFILVESPYKYSNRDSINIFESTDASYAQLVIKTPNDREPIFGDITAVGNNHVIFVIRHDMIDEIEEVGAYDFQIRLFDADQTSMATTPEVRGGLIIKEPIAKEDTTNNITNSAIIGSAVVTNDLEIPTFVSGSYNKTAWHDGDVISKQKLNKMEDGIYETYELSKDNSSQIKEKVTKGEGGVITPAMLSQEVKESMTGGSVAVVGDNTILTTNIVDKQVTPNKTSFMERDYSLNLFDGNYLPIHVAGFIPMAVNFNESSKTAIVKIKPNTVYSIIKNKASRFNLGTATQIIEPSKGFSLDGSVLQPLGNSAETHITITTGDSDNYLYVNVTADNEDVFLQIVEGTQEVLSVNTYPWSFTDDVMVYTKQEVDDKIDNKIIDKQHAVFIKRNNDINLYTGLKLENKRIGGNTSSGIRIEAATDSDIYIVPVEPNKTYSVIVKDTDLIYKGNKYIKALTYSDLVASDYTGNIDYSEYNQPTNKLNITLTTGENVHYMYLYLFTKNFAEENKVFQVVEGTQTSLTIENIDDCYEFTGISCYPKYKLYTRDQLDLMLSNISTTKNIFNKNGETFTITLDGKTGYKLEHKTVSSINLDTWMLTEGTANDIVLWRGTDIEAPIKEKGVEDFIGGVHGDEVFESISIICDGVLIDMSRDYNLSFKNLTVFVKSTLYRCNTNVPVFSRYKKLEFTNNELIVSNRLICLVDNFLVERYTGCGLYSVYKDVLTGYTVNTKPELITDGSSNGDKNLDTGSFYGNGFTVTIKTISGKSDYYKGSVADFKNESKPRYKLYLDSVNSSSGYQLNTNDELNASFSIKID